MLKLTVYDVDRHKRHHVIGHSFYSLKSHDTDNNERVVIWRDMEREATEVQVLLLYNDKNKDKVYNYIEKSKIEISIVCISYTYNHIYIPRKH